MRETMDPFELRRLERQSWRGIPERLGLSFDQGNIEMRAKPNGTPAGCYYEWNGYAARYAVKFPMWDKHGEPYDESVRQGVSKRSLNNPSLDVPFLIGHADWGIPMARTKSGTLKLSEDTAGLLTHVPEMDGSREDVRALYSAVKRGDMDEMSLAFVCTQQEWDENFEHRTITEWDLHRGDVSAVVHGANPFTAGAWMAPVEQLSARRPVAIGEHRAVAQADRDKANAAGNSLPDGSYPINNVHQLHAAAVLAASHHGDWKAAQALIRRRAKELGVDVTTLPGFSEENASTAPYELRASAADDMNLATASDYDAAAADHPYDGEHDHEHTDGTGGVHSHAHTHAGDGDHGHGHSASVMVDDATGIPGEETQFSDSWQRERRVRELELEELACRR